MDRVFDRAEDLRPPTAGLTSIKAVYGLKREHWRGMLHVTTSPTPRAGKVNPDILLNRLGPVGRHDISQYVWDQTVPPKFYGEGLRDFDVESSWMDAWGDHKSGTSTWIFDEVQQFVTALKRQGLLHEIFQYMPGICRRCMIPKSSKKVSLILSCVKQNGMDGCNLSAPAIFAFFMGAG